MLNRGTLLAWSGSISPIPDNWKAYTIAQIQTGLASSFSDIVITIDPVSPTSMGTETMHIRLVTLVDFNDLSNASDAISTVVHANTNLDSSSVQCSILALPDLMGGDPGLFPLGGGMAPIEGDAIVESIGPVPFFQPSPIFQPPQAVSPGRISPVTPTRASDPGAVRQKGTLPVRQSDVAPVVTPIDTSSPAILNPSSPVPPFLVVPPSDYVPPISPIDSNAYLPPIPVVTQPAMVTPTQTPVSNPVAPVVTPITTTHPTQTTTPAPDQVAPVVTPTTTPTAATNTGGSSTGLLIGAAIVGGLLLMSGRSKGK